MTDKKQDDARIYAAPNVTQPPINGTADVKAMGPAPYGLLCKCRGSVQPPSGAYFDALYFKVAKDGETYTPQQVVSGAEATIPSSVLFPGGGSSSVPANWSLDARLNAACNTGGTAPNKLYVVSRSIIYPPPPPPALPEVLETTITPFKGKSVQACATAATATVEEPENIEADMPPVADGIRVSPRDSDGEWLLYSGLSTANHFFGNRLMRNGQALRARLIAVAAANVDWSYSELSLFGTAAKTVRRAIGDLKIEPLGFLRRFPTLHNNGIVIWQNKLGLPEFGVHAQCRQHADLVHLDPNEDILVQVNYQNILQSSLSGSFDLWVKIVD